jgi:hypothetical protein
LRVSGNKVAANREYFAHPSYVRSLDARCNPGRARLFQP